MKTLKRLTYLLLVLFTVTSCERDYDAPPLNMPEYSGPAANTTLKQLKEKYATVTSAAPALIEESLVVKARVSANDISGNIFKQVIVQDETGGISMGVEQSSVYTTYRVGQEIFIDLKGLYVVNYGGALQIGYGNTNANRIPWEIFKEQVNLNAWPDSTLIVPTVISNFNDLKADMNNTVVQLDNVYFVNGGQSTFAVNESTTSQTLKDANGNSVDVRTSSYANFANDKLPSGTGTLIGVISSYNGSWQLTIRSKYDIKTFSGEAPIPPAGTGSGTGTKEDPYDIANAIAKQGETGVWVKAYIVGSVGDKALSTDSQFAAPFTNVANILIAADPKETNPNNCFPVQLPASTDVRTVLNLVDNPTNLGKEVTLKGDLVAYFGAAGMKNTSEYIFDGGVVTPEPPVSEGTGTGTEIDPYDLASAIAKQGESSVWIKAYIVGSVPSAALTDAEFVAPFTGASNIIVAASPTETDPSKCFPIQLKAGTDVRAALNLVDNPANKGKEVLLKGNLTTYFTVAGMKETSEYKIEGGTETPTPPTTVADGSKEAPFQVSDLAGKEGSTSVWFEGYIVGCVKAAALTDSEFIAPFSSETNFLIAATAGETDPTKCIPVQLPKALRSALGLSNVPDNKGKKIALKGDIATYFQTVGFKNTSEYEFK